MNESRSTPVDNGTECTSFEQDFESQQSNWWALGALALVLATAAGNILVCLAIVWEKRLQNVTNYFLMSLAITDLMVAILVMPLGILTLVRGFFPLAPVYCLAWICLDVLFCTASIMHLCTISVDRYISLKYPMKFGRNKSRRRVVLKIILVWILSIAMSLPLSLMYSQDNNSLLVEGICQIPDPLYKLVGSIICFYIPLGVMLLTYTLTVRLLAYQQRRLGGRGDWTTSWLQQKGGGEADKKNAWKSLLMPMQAMRPGGGQTFYSGGSADTEFTNLETNELWIQDIEPKPYKSSALHHFGQEMFKFSRGLNSTTSPPAQPVSTRINSKESLLKPPTEVKPDDPKTVRIQRYKSSTIPYFRKEISRSSTELRRRVYSYHETGTACTSDSNSDDEIVKSESCRALAEKLPKEKPGILTVVRTEENLTNSETTRHTIVPWRSEDLQKGSKKKLEEKVPLLIMRLAMPMLKSSQESSQPNFNTQSRNSIFITRNSSRNGRILRLEQKATKVLGVVFFTFVILWAPFFVLNLVPSLCRRCERFIGKWVFDFATWLGYSSSMVNPIFYTIFNKVFRQAFKNVLLCKYRHKQWEPPSKQ